VLRAVGGITRESIRADVDTAYRYGGDEFAVLLPNTETKDAWEVACRIKENISTSLQNIYISIGISSLDEHVTIKDFIQAADLAMYLDKTNHKDDNVISLNHVSGEKNT
jgi:diguanylate cyclase (GGDEF)-like protein